MLFREMKGSKFSCSSPASAAVCTSIDRRSIVCPGSGLSIDRHTPLLKDSFRASSPGHFPQPPTKPKPYNQKSRKSTGTQLDLISRPSLSSKHRSGENQTDLIIHENSSRFLLNDADGTFFNVFPDQKPVLALPLEEPKESAAILRSSSSTNVVQEQVVVLRVSLHCKGCEGKVRRHISKKGITELIVLISYEQG